MADDLRITINVQPVLEQLEGVRERATNMFPAMVGPIDRYVVAMLTAQAQSRGAFLNTPWPVLAPATIKRKGHDIPLFVSGKLMAGWIGAAAKRTAEPLRYSLINRVVNDKGFPYPIVQNEGSRTVPARPMVPTTFPPKILADLGQIIQRWVSKGELGTSGATGAVGA